MEKHKHNGQYETDIHVVQLYFYIMNHDAQEMESFFVVTMSLPVLNFAKKIIFFKYE